MQQQHSTSWLALSSSSLCFALQLALPSQALAAAVAQPQRLPQVVVTGTRTAKSQALSPVRTEVISRQEIERSHALTLKDALENLPGVQLSQIHGKSGYKVSMQGLSSDQVLVLIDGLPISPSTSSTTDLSQYALASVDHIEVVKGATSAQYGSAAMGGVINVITRPIAPGMTIDLATSVGSYGEQNTSGSASDSGKRHAKFNLEGGSQHWRLRLNGEQIDNDGFSIQPQEWTRQGDSVTRKQIGARVEWHPSDKGQVWLDSSAYREQGVSRYQFYVPPRLLNLSTTGDIERDRHTAGGHWRWQNGTKFSLKGLHERYDSVTQKHNTSGGGAFDHRHANLKLNHVNAQLDLPFWQHQLWSLGGDFHLETLQQSEDGISELQGGEVERNSKELYVQNDILFNEQWELLLGARWQQDSDFGSHAVPKASLRYTPDWQDHRLTLRASFGQGYRVPNLKERHFLFDHSSLGYKVIGNPNLLPEKSNSWQLGASLEWSRHLSAHLNLFRNRVSDLIQVDEASAPVINGITHFTYHNISDALTQGLETSVEWQPWSPLTLNLAYTYTHSENLDTGQQLTRRPLHIGRLGANLDFHSGTSLSLRTRYQSDALVSSASGARTPAWTRVDLKLNQQLRRGVDVFIGVDNLFDQQRDFQDPSDYSPSIGRFVYLGMNFHWASHAH